MQYFGATPSKLVICSMKQSKFSLPVKTGSMKCGKRSPGAALGTLSNTMPSAGRGGQFLQLISLSPGNNYQLKELAATSC